MTTEPKRTPPKPPENIHTPDHHASHSIPGCCCSVDRATDFKVCNVCGAAYTAEASTLICARSASCSLTPICTVHDGSTLGKWQVQTTKYHVGLSKTMAKKEEVMTAKEKKLQRMLDTAIETIEVRDKHIEGMGRQIAALHDLQNRTAKSLEHERDERQLVYQCCAWCGQYFDNNTPMQVVRQHLESCPQNPLASAKHTIRFLEQQNIALQSYIGQLQKEIAALKRKKGASK